MSSTVKVMFINNDGAGFADFIEVPANTTVQAFFGQRLPGGRAEDYLIRVNRLPVTADTLLREGDRVTITPTKIEGAAAQPAA